MKRFWSFVIKEFYHIFRDARTLLILFVLPVVLILIFGYVVTNEIKDARIAIFDPSKDNVTQQITNKIISSDYFILKDNLSSEKEIEQVFRDGRARIVLVFEEQFAEKLYKTGKAEVQLIADASDANTANLLVNYTQAIIGDYVGNLNTASQPAFQIEPRVRMVYNEKMKGAYMFVPGTMALILMLVSALMTSISIAREKEMGTMEVLLVSPLKPVQIILGKVTPYVSLSFVNAISIIVLGYYVFDVPVEGNLLLLIAECMLFILLALSLGLLISTLSKTQQMAMFISLFSLMLPTILLSGFIFPIENMPQILQWLSMIVPPKYFIIIIKNIMIKGTGIMFVWKETLVLIGMTLFFIAVSVKKFKVRLE
ncbi:MAG: ABC transporter permease [Bacteroidales bacterium]|nr:ABC transporter permease [Bacteroidales bacterium]MCF8351980.1 ABC transporter permease [Bacteroidales bacterium]MCF8377468.1 ABC transporter permease [Bacteroidales bacterium]MCF8401591.1 ABC transporter permease [Bacteroidales bacterium]